MMRPCTKSLPATLHSMVQPWERFGGDLRCTAHETVACSWLPCYP